MTVARNMELSPPSPRSIVEQTSTDEHLVASGCTDDRRTPSAPTAPTSIASWRLSPARRCAERADVSGRCPGAPRLAAQALSPRQRTGYLPPNVGAAVKLQQGKDKLAERILSEAEVHAMLALEPNRRNQILLRLLYIAGLRVSEIVGLTWHDLQPRTDGGQVTVFGKGSKTRVVLLPNAIWRELVRFRHGASMDGPVFASRRGGGHLHPSMVERIVTKAAQRADLEGKVSPHWLRHSHATHALERGAPIHLFVGLREGADQLRGGHECELATVDLGSQRRGGSAT